MTDKEREQIGLSKRDQNSFNAFMEIGKIIREMKNQTESQKIESWKQIVINDIEKLGYHYIRLFINHYAVAIRPKGKGFEAFLTDFKAWQSPDEVPYPDISKAKRNKPLAKFDTLEQAIPWIREQNNA